MTPAAGSSLPIPSPRQLRWHALELYGFLHFTVNTFTNKEWGYGDEDPSVFNPTAFDADQIVSTAKDGGLKGLILTCKHHDGFCLWPSALTEHSVKNSPWRSGKGDVVREISSACARHGLQFGVYLSPWDRNHPHYGQPEYIRYFRGQLRELLTGYGPLFEVWFDGANGGDGYYGGANETRLIDKTTYYEWEQTWALVRELQPGACIFSDGGPDIRWVGNERGIAGDPCWSTLTAEGLAPGLADSDVLNAGQRDGEQWLPAECDVSIRPGWFYHSEEDDRVKTAPELVDLYFKSVGRGASLLLNLPPDRRGLIHENDAASLHEFHNTLEQLFGENLALLASATPTSAYGLFDGDPNTFWSAGDGGEAELLFEHPVTFSVASLREFLPHGQRVASFALDSWSEGGWKEIANAASIGSRRLLRFDPVTTTRVRLRIVDTFWTAAISELALYR